MNLKKLLLVQCRNKRGVLGAVALPSTKKLPLLREYKNNIILFILPHFNFCPAIEKCYYMSIFFKMSIRATNVIHNESFKDRLVAM